MKPITVKVIIGKQTRTFEPERGNDNPLRAIELAREFLKSELVERKAAHDRELAADERITSNLPRQTVKPEVVRVATRGSN